MIQTQNVVMAAQTELFLCKIEGAAELALRIASRAEHYQQIADEVSGEPLAIDLPDGYTYAIRTFAAARRMSAGALMLKIIDMYVPVDEILQQAGGQANVGRR